MMRCRCTCCDRPFEPDVETDECPDCARVPTVMYRIVRRAA